MGMISNTIAHSITLTTSGTYSSPLTITATGSVSNSGAGDAVYGPNTASWSVDNYGQISATGLYAAIALYLGGSITNSGVISSADALAIQIAGAAGSVTNLGTIAGASFGVELTAGGSISNGTTSDTTALITGGAGSTGSYGNPLGGAGANGGTGVGVAGGSITNNGTIKGGPGGAGGASPLLGIGGTGGRRRCRGRAGRQRPGDYRDDRRRIGWGRQGRPDRRSGRGWRRRGLAGRRQSGECRDD